MLTPFGIAIRKARLDKHQTNLADMADALEVSSAYLSAVEHGQKPVGDALVKKVYLYFRELGISLQDWKRLADDSQPQMKLSLREDRETKLLFGREFDSLTQKKKDQIRKILEGGHGD